VSLRRAQHARVLLAGVLTFAVVTAGCSLAPTTPSGAQGPAGAQNAAQGEVLIGVMGPLTGDNAEYGKIWRRGFDLALEEINAAGGVQGRPLNYVFEDTQSDPKQTPAVAQKFVSDPRIVAVIGDFSSPASMAASPIFQRAGLVQLGITNSHPDFTKTGDYIWSNSGSQEDDAPFLATLAVEDLGKKRLAVLHMNTDWGQTSADLFIAKAESLGAEIVLREAYLLTEKDFRPVLTKARDANPDALILISYYNDGALIAQQIDDVGLDVTVVAIGSTYSPQFIALGGEAVEGVYTATRFHPADPRPEAQEFVRKYREKYGVEPDNFAAVAYDGIKILAAVLNEVGVDRKALRDGLEKAENLQTVMYGTTAFGEDRRLRNPRYLRLVVRNGAFEIWEP